MNAKEADYEFKMKKNAHNKWIIVGTTTKSLSVLFEISNS